MAKSILAESQPYGDTTSPRFVPEVCVVSCSSSVLPQPLPLRLSQIAALCPPPEQATERGWNAYRANDIPTAAGEFKRALALCPKDPGALTGAGYAAMREGRITEARAFFARAIAVDSASYDAVAGAGMAAYRAGD